jgi:hypothetical protein
MSKRKRAKARRHRHKSPPSHLSKAVLRATSFFHRHRIATILSGAIALLGSLASIYALSEPNMVAISPSTAFNGALRAEPNGGLALWIEFEQRFKNDSWRGGGHITSLQMVPRSLDAAFWFPNKTVPNYSETFGAYDEKIVKSNALFQFPQLAPGKKYPGFVVDIQFLDQKGAVIRERGSGKPYSFPFTVTESAVNSLKAISDPGK